MPTSEVYLATYTGVYISLWQTFGNLISGVVFVLKLLYTACSRVCKINVNTIEIYLERTESVVLRTQNDL